MRYRTSPLSELDAAYLEFTNTPGLLRCIRKDEPYDRAQGLYLGCPKCAGSEKAHGITVLFDLHSVPSRAKPEGRWKWHKAPLSNVSLQERLSPDCGLIGNVTSGDLRWR